MTNEIPQIEIQLGHLCNNRCVFCVSGQVSEWKQAGQIPAEPVREELRRARERGTRRVTFLGGEPTIQRSFFDVLAYAHELGFEDVVLFTNGVMTPKRGFIDKVLALGPLTWRFSLQGADHEHHDATTKKPGSFQKILDGLESLRPHDAPVTANMCLTRTNYASLPKFPELVARYGITQLHIDMVRPSDAGERTIEYLGEIMPRYSDMRDAIRTMLEGFDDGFDINVGNYPYCLLPEHAHRIHHDGQQTLTVSASGQSGLEPAWDKYEVKRQDKTHPEPCESCLFRPRCNGLFEIYQQIYGVDELLPITLERLRATDPEMRFFGLQVQGYVDQLVARPAPPGWGPPEVQQDEHARRVTLRFRGPGALVLELSPPGRGLGPADLVTNRFEARVAVGGADPSRAMRLATWACEQLVAHDDVVIVAPFDAAATTAHQIAAMKIARYAEALRVRGRFGGWTYSATVPTAEGLDVELRAGTGARLLVHLHRPAVSFGKAGVSYSFLPGDLLPETEQRAVVAAVVDALRAGARPAA